MRVVVHMGQDGQRLWTAVQSNSEPVPLASGTRGYPDVDACFDAARQFVESDSMLALQDGDGRWGWVAYGHDGTPTAQSPSRYDNAAACGSALRELRGLLALERA
jgi:hypothetical protein